MKKGGRFAALSIYMVFMEKYIWKWSILVKN